MSLLFFYGSAVEPAGVATTLGRELVAGIDYQLGRLRGYERIWNVATDSSKLLPGYKTYLYPDGRPFTGFVTFLNIRARRGRSIDGLLVRVTPEDIYRFDDRERNYRRVLIKDSIDLEDQQSTAQVWTYLGLDAARERYETGVDRGTAVIQRAYQRAVVEAYEIHGPDLRAMYHESTVAPSVPVIDLQRLNLPSLPNSRSKLV